jgi:hypothetical protein
MKKILFLFPAIVFLAAGCGSAKPASQSSNEPNNQQTTNAPAKTTANSPASSGSSTWQSTLELTDNTASGNYFITISGHKIYLRTSRDYSSLVGKQVNVSYTGDLTSFTLNDITAQ